MKKIIDGKKIAEKIKDGIVKEILDMNNKAICPVNRPNLAIILVGDREDSKLYVDLKEKEAIKVGIDTHVYRCEKNISANELIDTINFLNNDENVDAILIQLPLPEGFDTDGIIMAMDPAKDVDRFHPKNLEIFFKTCDHAHVMPPLILTILKILEEIKYQIKDKNICIISNSELFGKTCAKALECKMALTTITNINDKDLRKKTSQADVLITAVGKKHFIKSDMIKEGSIIIDIGITKKNKKTYGDVDFEDVKDKVSFITPVPGGVGPITIAMLFKNTLELYKQKRGKSY